MTAIRIAWSELRRITATRNARIVVLALALIPALYAGVYLYANHDPYANLKYVPAALVVADQGSTATDGTRTEAGRQVADELLASGSFQWHEVDLATAKDGVQEGRYDFALVIPQGFSESLTGLTRLEPEQAKIQLITNDTNSYLSTSIANTLSKQVLASLSAKVSQNAAEQFLLGITDVRSGLVSGADGGDKLVAGLAQLQSGAAKAHKGAESLASGADQLNTGATSLDKGLGKLVAGAAKAQDGAAAIADGADKLDAGAQKLASGLGQLADATADLPDQTAQLAQGARKVADGNAKVAGYGDQAATAASTLQTRYQQRREDLVNLMDSQGLTAEQQQALLAGYDKLEPSIADLTTKVTTAASQLDALATGADQVADGNEKLAAATPALVKGISDAQSGAEKLAKGAAALSDGASELASGLTDLHTGLVTAKDGSAELAAGSEKLATGADKLATGLADLQEGLDAAHEGATTLAAGLRTGAEQIPEVNDDLRAQIADTIANPVVVKAVSQASAGSYGAGLAPYFLSLAAWIGAYALFLLVRPLSRRALAANQAPLRIALGGWLPPALIGVLQMLIVLAIVAFGVGIHSADLPGTLLFLLLLSATFVAILHFLNAALGSTGQFIGLCLMILQLVTAGGTFPWQTLPRPIAWLHNVLPMTRGVNGLRQLLYGGTSPRLLQDILALVAFLVVSLLATSLIARRQRIWTPKRLRPEVAM